MNNGIQNVHVSKEDNALAEEAKVAANVLFQGAF